MRTTVSLRNGHMVSFENVAAVRALRRENSHKLEDLSIAYHEDDQRSNLDYIDPEEVVAVASFLQPGEDWKRVDD